ncbi:glutathione S-transferase family protein [Dongia deserti]|uniref:glutathione S-transferase family protein n=1 Tax=Dongia deserti TaxID=2268030 RepID=UPI000E64EE28|nr:glutathione S-transferase family protein [Dongia deserti]
MYILYHFPYSQHARRVVSLLEAAGLPYELRHVDMAKGEHLSAAYLATNPNHQVPTLLDGDLKLHESNAILRYLCQKHALTDWYPSDLAHRARVDQWLDWNQCRLSPAVIDVVRNKVFLGDKGDKAAIERGEARLRELGPILEEGLGADDFLTGAKSTIADLSVASNLFQLGLAEAIPPGERIAAWYRRIGALEGFRRSLPRQ